MKSGKVIDFHVHPFDGREYNLVMYPETAVLSPDGMKAQLIKAGISHICGSVLTKEKEVDSFKVLRELNRQALRFKERLGDFYTPGFHVHPAYVMESCDEIEYMHSQGVKLIGELVPYMHGWGETFSEKNWEEILDTASQYHMVCSYHTPFTYDMRKMIKKHPNMTFVAAHPGERQRVAEHIEILKECPNLLLDLSGTGLHRFGVLKHLIKEVGAERIVFGTDYPICNPQMYVRAVYGEDITDADREAVFYGNVERVLGL